mgnify:CR=1 FL=1
MTSFLVDTVADVHKDNRLQIAERIKEIDSFLQKIIRRPLVWKNWQNIVICLAPIWHAFFKAHLGVTLGQYLATIRAQKARDSLIETKDCLTDIAFKTWF